MWNVHIVKVWNSNDCRSAYNVCVKCGWCCSPVHWAVCCVIRHNSALCCKQSLCGGDEGEGNREQGSVRNDYRPVWGSGLLLWLCPIPLLTLNEHIQCLKPPMYPYVHVRPVWYAWTPTLYTNRCITAHNCFQIGHDWRFIWDPIVHM